MRYAILIAVATALGVGTADAGSQTYCLVCKDPDQSYACRVDTPKASPGQQALQLYCIVRTAKDGGHRSCKAARRTAAGCKGSLKAYTYRGPSFKRRAQEPPASAPASAGGARESKPTPLMRYGKRAVKASGRGLRKAAGRTGRAVGSVTKNTGQRVSGAARGAGSAARTAYDCVRTLFRRCRPRRDEDGGAPDAQEALP